MMIGGGGRASRPCLDPPTGRRCGCTSCAARALCSRCLAPVGQRPDQDHEISLRLLQLSLYVDSVIRDVDEREFRELAPAPGFTLPLATPSKGAVASWRTAARCPRDARGGELPGLSVAVPVAHHGRRTSLLWRAKRGRRIGGRSAPCRHDPSQQRARGQHEQHHRRRPHRRSLNPHNVTRHQL